MEPWAANQSSKFNLPSRYIDSSLEPRLFTYFTEVFPLARPKNWTELLPKSISGPKPTQMSNTTTFCLSIMFLSACESQKERAGESERELACESACLAIKFLISALALWARRVTRSLVRGHCWLPPFAAVPTTTTSRNKQNIFRSSLFAFNYAIV